MSPETKNKTEQPMQLGQLGDFDQQYFDSIKGEDSWIALGNDAYKNQRYFTGLSTANEKVGIVGVYDTDKDQNILHYVVDPKYRGQGLARQLTDELIAKLSLKEVILTIDLDNTASIKAAEKLPGIKKISTPKDEEDYHKVKYRYKMPEEIEKN